MKFHANTLRHVLVGAGALALALTVISIVLDLVIEADVKEEMGVVLGALRDIAADSGTSARGESGAALMKTCCREWPKLFDGFVICLNRDNDEIVASASPRARPNDRADEIFKDFHLFKKRRSGEQFIARVYDSKSYCLILDHDTFRLVAVVPCQAISKYRDVPLLAFGLVLLALVSIFTLSTMRRARLLARLQGYINGEKLRLKEDLAAAQLVQMSALPPPFPRQPSFAISARMDPAKVVGGDFYDYQILPDGMFYFLIADVSGKGISAAMFMMRAKSVIKQCLAETRNLSVGMTKANALLAANNDSKIFVTAWVGVLNPRTGRVAYVNAGHNPPIVRRADENASGPEWVKCPPSLVLALLPDTHYPVHELFLSPGDTLFLYTDGVTETQNVSGRLYGEKRLAKTLAAADTYSIDDVRADLNAFQGLAEPADDATMVLLEYLGTPPGAARGFPCNREIGLVESIKFLEKELTRVSSPADIRTKFMIAYDEIGSNIISYSGAEYFTVKVSLETTPQAITVTVTDAGMPFNPLSKSAPDLTLPLEKRTAGGFGIFITRQLMDDVIYSHDEGLNVLTLRKLIPQQ